MAQVQMNWEGDEWLDFLPPVDEDLLDCVGDDDSSSPQSSQTFSSSLVPQKRRPKRVNMLKEELLTLQHEKEKLEALLAMLHAKHESKSVWLSDKQQKWQRVAQKQLELKLKAEREHEQLSAMLVEQSVMKREMEAILFKKPRLMMKKLQDENWRSLKLSAQSERRHLDIHAIADRQLESIDSDMLSLGLLESTETIESVRHNLSTNFSEGIVCTKFQAVSFSQIETAIWKTILSMHSASPLQHFIIRHPLDDNTTFVRLKYAIPNCKVKVESALILKRQQVGPRAVRMVLRSIANDEADPFEPDSFVCDHYAWQVSLPWRRADS
ncbi:hypothetical protein AC1031_007302 [Aphanomyces cochlioides]|nr:hypothetical protein AC1031_007302 [Aphanomyces cochlioides]